MAEYKDITSIKEQIAHVKRNVKSENSAYLIGYTSALSTVEGMIASLPEADVKPVKHGYLIVRTKQKTPLSQAYIRIEKTFECSCCGAVHRRRMNYCGECGAKMDGKEVQE